jgi:hypothetical protein
VTVDKYGAQVLIHPKELTRVFCSEIQLPQDHQFCSNCAPDPLLTREHAESIANFMVGLTQNREEAPGLERLMQQATLNINYGLTDFNQHQLYQVNPRAVKKAELRQSPQFPNEITGLLLPHFNPQEQQRRQLSLLRPQLQAEQQAQSGAGDLHLSD